ncbi:MAG: chaperonin GroEL [Planctomycetota bacterium]|nr:chaperonin GroEL [Planctomycetota bacterium]MDA0934033.1 chaperonin GroEL [Planctomycetota bacterium]MDA1221735.1 chaperonin GroEL [Planctomycetota bacterium]
MTHTVLRVADEAREKILAGATALAEAVRPTLGPRSKCVLLGRRFGNPVVCNDGVTIAREIHLEDPEQDLGVRVLREAAIRTGDRVGDGTTTATLLAHAIFADGLRNVVAGASAVALGRGIELGRAAAIEAIELLSTPCETRAQREQVATVSAHNDPAIGTLVAEAMERVGAEGIVTLEETKGTETEIEVVEGMQFDRGFASPYFVTESDRMEAVLEDPLILLYDGKLARVDVLLPLLEKVLGLGGSLLVIAEAIEGEALATLVVNKLRGSLRCAAVKAPGYGDRRKATMQDLAILTGGTWFAEELGLTLDKVEPGQLGRARRAIVDRESTTIVGGAGEPAALDARRSELRAAIGKPGISDYDREKLEERLARLSGGVAVIRVGAASEAEMKNRKEAFEDAIAATKAAVTAGVVPGGGVALVRAIPAVEALAASQEGDIRTGLQVLARALEAPLRQIARNSGFDPGVVAEHVRAAEGPFGFDAAQGVYADLVAQGITDPTEVVRTALDHAVSVARTLLLTEASLTEVSGPEERSATAGLD